MRAFFRRDCCALIFFHVSARSRFIAVRCCVALMLSRAVLCRTCCLACVGGARVPRLPAARAATCATCDGELRESNPRPRAPEARILPLDQAPKHIMAACDECAHCLRFCGRCPRALVQSLMVALSTLRLIGLPYLLVVCALRCVALLRSKPARSGLRNVARDWRRNRRRRRVQGHGDA